VCAQSVSTGTAGATPTAAISKRSSTYADPARFRPAGRTATEAVNGRLENLRGSALGFPHLTNYIAHSLLEAIRIQAPTTPSIAMSRLTGTSPFRSASP
jgi:hypothetical protein